MLKVGLNLKIPYEELWIGIFRKSMESLERPCPSFLFKTNILFKMANRRKCWLAKEILCKWLVKRHQHLQKDTAVMAERAGAAPCQTSLGSFGIPLPLIKTELVFSIVKLQKISQVLVESGLGKSLVYTKLKNWQTYLSLREAAKAQKLLIIIYDFPFFNFLELQKEKRERMRSRTAAMEEAGGWIAQHATNVSMELELNNSSSSSSFNTPLVASLPQPNTPVSSSIISLPSQPNTPISSNNASLPPQPKTPIPSNNASLPP